jgi:hypothetical protein
MSKHCTIGYETLHDLRQLPLLLPLCCWIFNAAGFLPLDPVQQPQVSKVDIYPGLADGLGISAETWNSYITTVPDDSTLQHLYDTGRADTAAWVAANIPSKAGEIEGVKAATAYNVNEISVTDVAAAAINLLGLVVG